MASGSQGLGDFIQQLEAPRFIKIFVNDRTTPYLIPESTLINSSDYFAKAVEHEKTLGGSEPGVLRFPEDGEFERAWKILLYWMVNKCIPCECEIGFNDTPEPEKGKVLDLVHVWALANRYLLSCLEDEVMLELLFESTIRPLTRDHDELYAMLRLSPVSSSLRRLLAEDAIRLSHEEPIDDELPKNESTGDEHVHGSQKSTDAKSSVAQYLEKQDGIFGLAGSLMHAYQAFMSHEKEYPRCKTGEVKLMAWKEYLQGTWPLHIDLVDKLVGAGLSPYA